MQDAWCSRRLSIVFVFARFRPRECGIRWMRIDEAASDEAASEVASAGLWFDSSSLMRKHSGVRSEVLGPGLRRDDKEGSDTARIRHPSDGGDPGRCLGGPRD